MRLGKSCLFHPLPLPASHSTPLHPTPPQPTPSHPSISHSTLSHSPPHPTPPPFHPPYVVGVELGSPAVYVVGVELGSPAVYMLGVELGSPAVYVASLNLLTQCFDPHFLLIFDFVWQTLLLIALSCLPTVLLRVQQRRCAPSSYSKHTRKLMSRNCKFESANIANLLCILLCCMHGFPHLRAVPSTACPSPFPHVSACVVLSRFSKCNGSCILGASCADCVR